MLDRIGSLKCPPPKQGTLRPCQPQNTADNLSATATMSLAGSTHVKSRASLISVFQILLETGKTFVKILNEHYTMVIITIIYCSYLRLTFRGLFDTFIKTTYLYETIQPLSICITGF